MITYMSDMVQIKCHRLLYIVDSIYVISFYYYIFKVSGIKVLHKSVEV